MRWFGHGLFVLVLTVLTQVGGLAWVVAVFFRRRWLVFPLAYAALWCVAFVAAPALGRTPLPCWGETLRMQSPVYCVLMRNYVTPEMADVARDAARSVATQYPGTVTLALDGNFPFLDGFPLIPHLSHDDGEKLDFAFFYAREDRHVPGRTRSPIGYFAFEALDAPICPKGALTLRWDMRAMQAVWRPLRVDVPRTSTLIETLLADARVGKIFLEPPLQERWALRHPKLRFQGCRAARHDDHIHVQLAAR